jgi:hypothetical protein
MGPGAEECGKVQATQNSARLAAASLTDKLSPVRGGTALFGIGRSVCSPTGLSPCRASHSRNSASLLNNILRDSAATKWGRSRRFQVVFHRALRVFNAFIGSIPSPGTS